MRARYMTVLMLARLVLFSRLNQKTIDSEEHRINPLIITEAKRGIAKNLGIAADAIKIFIHA
jgi:hypothetical protein